MKIKTESLVPVQKLRSGKKIERSCDCYYQKFLKFPEVGIFHSYSELIHAALLESSSKVTMFVPQPFKFLIGNRPYIPDCYLISEGKKFVIELKPRGEFSESKEVLLKEYLGKENIQFKVISNEKILDQEMLALNWLEIIRTLIANKHIETFNQENEILYSLSSYEKQYLGDFISKNDRFNRVSDEIALYRLAHQGKIKINLENDPISFQSEVELCT